MEKYRIADFELAESGRKKMDWAWQYMPVVRSMHERYKDEQPLRGVRLAACLHLEAKTACLLRTLRDLGADVVAAGSNPLSTQDDVCAGLVSCGVNVFSHHGMTGEEYFSNLRSVLDHRPQIIVDDGADLVTMVHEERKDLIPAIEGGSEETTSGVKRLKAMVREKVLSFPMISVNDAYSKYLFDNRYGTGQSVWDGMIRTTNMLVAGKSVVVVGYGWCGHGVALRARALGARVIVVEVNPHRAFEAIMDGHEVMNMMDAARCGDMFITLTGNSSVIRREHFEVMKDGVLLANAGHFDVEICKPDLEELSLRCESPRQNVDTYVMKDGRRLHLLAEGRLVNLAAADGHPIEIMDLSFGLQLASAIYVHTHSMDPGLYDVPSEIDEDVMRRKLVSMGIVLDEMTAEQKLYMKSWKE